MDLTVQSASEVPLMWQVDFDKTPFLIIWETTQACELACKHCRASAMPGPIPGELSTDQGKNLLDQAKDLGTPLIVLSGGDPASRPDLFELIRHGKGLGLRMATIPAATQRLNRDLLFKLKDAGIDQVAFSLDFPTADKHDAFRGYPGTYDHTMRAIEWAHEAKIPPQINTCVWGDSADTLSEMGFLVEKLGIVFWEVFFLVPIGRGADISKLNTSSCEAMFPILHAAQKRNKFILKVTEAPHYRRYLKEHEAKEKGRVNQTVDTPSSPSGHPGGMHKMMSLGGTSDGTKSIPLAERGVNAGSGFLFISSKGEMYPSGFLALSGGNVCKDTIASGYRESELFKNLRDPNKLKGRCGRCPHRRLCGGSRSRAWAMTGDYLETDPWCSYQPQQ